MSTTHFQYLPTQGHEFSYSDTPLIGFYDYEWHKYKEMSESASKIVKLDV
jgi:hypothetical protein